MCGSHGGSGRQNSIRGGSGRQNSIRGGSGRQQDILGGSGRQNSVRGGSGRQQDILGNCGRQQEIHGRSGRLHTSQEESGRLHTIDGGSKRKHSIHGATECVLVDSEMVVAAEFLSVPGTRWIGGARAHRVAAALLPSLSRTGCCFVAANPRPRASSSTVDCGWEAAIVVAKSSFAKKT